MPQRRPCPLSSSFSSSSSSSSSSSLSFSVHFETSHVGDGNGAAAQALTPPTDRAMGRGLGLFLLATPGERAVGSGLRPQRALGLRLWLMGAR